LIRLQCLRAADGRTAFRVRGHPRVALGELLCRVDLSAVAPPLLLVGSQLARHRAHVEDLPQVPARAELHVPVVAVPLLQVGVLAVLGGLVAVGDFLPAFEESGELLADGVLGCGERGVPLADGGGDFGDAHVAGVLGEVACRSVEVLLRLGTVVDGHVVWSPLGRPPPHCPRGRPCWCAGYWAGVVVAGLSALPPVSSSADTRGAGNSSSAVTSPRWIDL